MFKSPETEHELPNNFCLVINSLTDIVNSIYVLTDIKIKNPLKLSVAFNSINILLLLGSTVIVLLYYSYKKFRFIRHTMSGDDGNQSGYAAYKHCSLSVLFSQFSYFGFCLCRKSPEKKANTIE